MILTTVFSVEICGPAENSASARSRDRNTNLQPAFLDQARLATWTGLPRGPRLPLLQEQPLLRDLLQLEEVGQEALWLEYGKWQYQKLPRMQVTRHLVLIFSLDLLLHAIVGEINPRLRVSLCVLRLCSIDRRLLL
jgi:hypothetical protein